MKVTISSDTTGRYSDNSAFQSEMERLERFVVKNCHRISAAEEARGTALAGLLSQTDTPT